jgi:adenosylcobinamide-phosphate synthase
MTELTILLLALILDILFGELPNMLHPVAWLGKLIGLESRIAPRKGKNAQLIYGLVTLLLTTALITLLVYFLMASIRQYDEIVYILIGALLLKFTFSIRGLIASALKIKTLLKSKDLSRSRSDLNALVSRDTGTLSEDEVIAATVESVSENTCDSFIAPVFYFLIFGLPGAIAYRIVNTFDSMIGYHDKYEYSGKCAARVDDILNYIPARISAMLIVLASSFQRDNMRRAWSIMFRDHKRTESPNAGWTMSAMAGSLGIKLVKAGHYQLGDAVNAISLKDIDSSLKIVILTFAVWSLIAILLQVVLNAAI